VRRKKKFVGYRILKTASTQLEEKRFAPFRFNCEEITTYTRYFEAFHTVQACSESLLFIPTECPQYVKYIYLSPITANTLTSC